METQTLIVKFFRTSDRMTYHDHIDNILPKVDCSPLQKSKVGILSAIVAAW